MAKIEAKKGDTLLNHERILLYGTKVGSVINYMSKLWHEDSTCKVIMFSQNEKTLHLMKELLSENHIKSATIEGYVQYTYPSL
jgi:SNF2 family DNA or RNA helicase